MTLELSTLERRRKLNLAMIGLLLTLAALFASSVTAQGYPQAWRSGNRAYPPTGYQQRALYRCFQRPVIVYYGRGFGYYVRSQVICVPLAIGPQPGYGPPTYGPPPAYRAQPANRWESRTPPAAYAWPLYGQVRTVHPVQPSGPQFTYVAPTYGTPTAYGTQTASPQSTALRPVYGQPSYGDAVANPMQQATSRQYSPERQANPDTGQSQSSLTLQEAIVGLNDTATIVDGAGKVSQFLDDLLEFFEEVLGM